MGANGGFTFVLNGHFPYLPHTSRPLIEFAGETLIPLLHTLNRLKNDNIQYACTIVLSPLLIEQLNNPNFPAQLNAYFDDQIARAQADVAFFKDARLTTSDPHNSPGDPHLAYLGEWYATWYQRLSKAFNQDFDGDIVGTFKQLQEAGLVEIAASAATHAYLPLLDHQPSIIRQVKVGIESYERTFGRRPTTFWLPELAYRKGIEKILADADIQVFLCESHMLTGGPPVGVAAGQTIGNADETQKKYVMPQITPEPVHDTSTLQPYTVDAVSKLAVVARDNRSVMQVAGNELGYPWDVDYLASDRFAATSGLRYWRVTGHKVARMDKDPYHPDWAAYKVEQHSEHFAHLIGDMIHGYFSTTEQYGFIASVLDLRLFGSSWFEGSRWLEQTLRHLANTPEIELTTPSRFIAEHPPQRQIELLEGSWGVGGEHFVVENPETHWLWERIHSAQTRLDKIDHEALSDDAKTVYGQAVRELMLMQSSDWASTMTHAPNHATQVFETYAGRFERLVQSLEAGKPDQELAAFYQRSDNIFADSDLIS